MKNKYLKSACLVLCLMTLLSGCGKKTSNNAAIDYMTISSVDGIIFEIPQAFSSKATAVTKVADDQNFAANEIYSYTNGNDEFMFFCMDELVILANKGTNFHFSQAEDKENALGTSSVIDSMCSKLGKKLNFTESNKDGAYKFIAEVSENVSITTELYGDYIGKLAVIEDGTDEWSVLVGVKGISLSDISKEQLSVVNSVTDSMKITDGEYVVKNNTPEYDVVINDDASETASSDEASSEISVEQKKEPEQEKEEAPSKEPDDVVVFEENTDQDDDSGASASIENSTEGASTEDTPEENALPETEKDAETENTSDNTENETTSKPEEKIHDNQKERDLSEEKVYDSDVYSLLKVGNYGITVCAGTNNDVQYPVVHLKNIYTGPNAIKVVQDQAASTSRYDYFEAPLGYSWQVAEYDVIYTDPNSRHEIDVRMLGVDGNKLVYRGVPAPQRTYLADYEAESDPETGTLYNLKVFYAVPNGCKEYVLKFGDGQVGTETEHYSAYYHIQDQ